MPNIDTQILFIVLITLGVFVIVLFALDVYHLTKKSREKREEKNIMSLKLSETFLSELEKMINQEIKKNISEINQKIGDEMTNAYKNEVVKFGSACSEAANSMPEEVKKRIDELSKGLDEKISQIYQTAEESIKQKITQTEKNIEDYKKEKLKETDQKIYQIIETVAKKTIGETIDLSTHEELIIQSLEKAKKEIF